MVTISSVSTRTRSDPRRAGESVVMDLLDNELSSPGVAVSLAKGNSVCAKSRVADLSKGTKHESVVEIPGEYKDEP